MYNLEVGQWHNFLVGISGVVVHNTGCFEKLQKFLDDIPVLNTHEVSKIMAKVETLTDVASVKRIEELLISGRLNDIRGLKTILTDIGYGQKYQSSLQALERAESILNTGISKNLVEFEARSINGVSIAVTDDIDLIIRNSSGEATTVFQFGTSNMKSKSFNNLKGLISDKGKQLVNPPLAPSI